jgi:site-specific recombinase XerD
MIMATLVKIKKKRGLAYRLQYTINHKRYSEYFPIGTDLEQVRAFKKRIEAEVAGYRSGLTDRVPTLDGGLKRRDRTTLQELTDILGEKRINKVDRTTLRRNLGAMRNFIECLGPDLLAVDLDVEKMEQFKNYRLDLGVTSKEGINKDLENIRTMLNDAANRGLIPENPVRKMPFFKTERKLPKFYSPDQIIELKRHFNDEMWLAFNLLIYTGCRRCELFQYQIGDDRGLRWKDILWFQDQIRVYGKGEEKLKAMPEILKKELAAEMRIRQQNGTFDVDDLVVHYVSDTITDKVRTVLKKCGIYEKGRVVHAFRHTFATETLKAKDGNIRLTQELLDHKNISTTQIYTHIISAEKKKAVADLPY